VSATTATATGVRRVPRGPLRPLRDALAVAGGAT
jgi:hypothetical protein